jgi:hypothetical protein
MFDFLVKRGILLMVPDLPHCAISYAHSEDEVDVLGSRVEEYLRSEAI